MAHGARHAVTSDPGLSERFGSVPFLQASQDSI